MKDKKQHVYIIGSKGIPAKYGGFDVKGHKKMLVLGH
ncbi:DUF1972 domain-containing protein [Enterococcus avium]|nr:DUF1972 domain-containing protein [Enterococcus avium]MDT2424009.1 DUF1972 domain-containing protein [Enterococcus avium]